MKEKAFVYPKILTECPLCGNKDKRGIPHKRSSKINRIKEFNPLSGKMEEIRSYRKLLYKCSSCRIEF